MAFSAPLTIFPGCTGAVAQATVAICGNTSTSNILYSEWYCQRRSLGRSIITSILPTILLMLWQNLIMPNALYRYTSPLFPPPATHVMALDPQLPA